jgi:hypothetical protein
MPDDFSRVALGRTYKQLQAHYGVGEPAIRRWMRESGLYVGRRELPAIVTELAKTMCLREIADAIHWKHSTLRERLAAEMPEVHRLAVMVGREKHYQKMIAAAKVRKENSERHPRIVEKRKPAARGPRYNYTPSRATVGTEQAMPKTTADLAMRFLQRFAPCYPRRVFDARYNGYIFKMRPGVLTADEIVAEAEKRGWRVDSWGVAA